MGDIKELEGNCREYQEIISIQKEQLLFYKEFCDSQRDEIYRLSNKLKEVLDAGSTNKCG